MTVFLLDVNVLIALADPMHVVHEAAHHWFAAEGRHGWATCPLTENGFVRVASHPSYPNRPGDASALLTILRDMCAGPGHAFWPDDVSLRDIVRPGAVLTHGQATDVYLLGLAVHHGGRLATFDRHLAATLVEGGPEALATVPAWK